MNFLFEQALKVVLNRTDVKKQIEFLGVGQKSMAVRLWKVKALGFKFHVGLCVERYE